MNPDTADNIPPDPVAEILRARELAALKMITGVRLLLVVIMTPLVWLLGFNLFDRVATLILMLAYAIAVGVSAYLIHRRGHLTVVGLTGVALDILMISTLPFIWYTSLGGGELPAGLTLKTSITLFAILFIALNALTMRPLYPLLVTVGALMVHLVLVGIAVLDENTVFTSSYLHAYTTQAVASDAVAIKVIMVALTGAILWLLTLRARRMIVEAARLQKTNVQLGRYFSPNLVRRLTDNPDLLKVGGERRDLSFVFTDLEGFTSLVETNDPALVMPLLNGYLEALVRVAFKHEGTVDKIVGDAVHVIFGAPVTQPDHPARALACALEMDAVAQNYRRRTTPDITLGVTRIGVNSGSAMVGNFGGDALFDYTAHGDSINIAARLEGANKYLGTRICVSADTVSRIPGFIGRPVGTLWLKGKRQGIEVFEPLPDTQARALKDYNAAFDRLRDGQPDALAGFTELCARYPDDALARFHLTRVQQGRTDTRIVLEDK